ncbi:MAG: hypothetical protein O2931_00005 [Planctomycetota bacterium]|nr:hypothetical protein [Planctomycetota bacterium]MDA1177156.1 hypothetical protein [Planctomycetota bacterium]
MMRSLPGTLADGSTAGAGGIASPWPAAGDGAPAELPQPAEHPAAHPLSQPQAGSAAQPLSQLRLQRLPSKRFSKPSRQHLVEQQVGAEQQAAAEHPASQPQAGSAAQPLSQPLSQPQAGSAAQPLSQQAAVAQLFLQRFPNSRFSNSPLQQRVVAQDPQAGAQPLSPPQAGAAAQPLSHPQPGSTAQPLSHPQAGAADAQPLLQHPPTPNMRSSSSSPKLCVHTLADSTMVPARTFHFIDRNLLNKGKLQADSAVTGMPLTPIFFRATLWLFGFTVGTIRRAKWTQGRNRGGLQAGKARVGSMPHFTPCNLHHGPSRVIP